MRQKQLFCFQVIKASHSSSQAREHIAQTFSSVGVYLDFFFLNKLKSSILLFVLRVRVDNIGGSNLATAVSPNPTI